jgi:hypothetical protein
VLGVFGCWWFYLTYQKLKKKLESDKYALCKVFFLTIFMRIIKYNSIICFITFLFLYYLHIVYECVLFTMFIAEKTIYNVIVFYDKPNKENAQYLVENMEHRDNYITKKYHIDFDEGKQLFVYLYIRYLIYYSVLI